MLREIAAAGTFLDDEDINQFLNLSLPGLDELMALFEISAWVEARQYDCIVVDTAPSGHTLRLLAMPELIRRWLGMLEVLLAKRRYMRRVFSRDVEPDRLDLFVIRVEVHAAVRPRSCCTIRCAPSSFRWQLPSRSASPRRVAAVPGVAEPEGAGSGDGRESAPPGVRLLHLRGR